MNLSFSELATLYRDALLREVLPFWEGYSIDREHGGYFTCLDRQGNVYDTDKFIWLQARQVWTFSMLCNLLEKRDSWLRIARHGAEFLRQHGMDADGNWYFALNRQGRPLVQPYNIFSDCFAAMAFSQYSLAAADEEAKTLAERTYRNILRRRDNPKGRYDKRVPGARPMKSLALPMILIDLSVEMEWQLDPAEFEETIGTCVREVMSLFVHEGRGLIFEHVSPDGWHPDCFDGRQIIPGHGIEAMWFVMDVARRKGDTQLIDRAVDAILRMLEFSWDQTYGGIFYFMDAEGKPPEKLEWDQKLWWVHNEALVALVMGYSLTGREECWDWYGRVHDYTWSHFPDPDYGEWWGYLNRQGEVLLKAKGGKWKGCFHVPRAIYLCWKQFQQLAASSDLSNVSP